MHPFPIEFRPESFAIPSEFALRLLQLAAAAALLFAFTRSPSASQPTAGTAGAEAKAGNTQNAAGVKVVVRPAASPRGQIPKNVADSRQPQPQMNSLVWACIDSWMIDLFSYQCCVVFLEFPFSLCTS